MNNNQKARLVMLNAQMDSVVEFKRRDDNESNTVRNVAAGAGVLGAGYLGASYLRGRTARTKNNLSGITEAVRRGHTKNVASAKGFYNNSVLGAVDRMSAAGAEAVGATKKTFRQGVRKVTRAVKSFRK